MADIKKIEIDYRTTAEDYRRALFWHNRKKTWIVVGIVLLVFLSAVYFTATTPSGGQSIAALVYVVIIGAAIFGITYYNIWRQAKKIARIVEPAKITLDENGLASVSESSSMQMDWADFEQIAETKTDFILYPFRNVFYPIPKRAFKSENEIGEFKQLLQSKISDRVNLINS